MRRVAISYAKTRDQSDPVRGSNEEALSSYYTIFQSFDPATFFCKEIPYGTGFTFVGFNFAEPTFFPL